MKEHKVSQSKRSFLIQAVAATYVLSHDTVVMAQAVANLAATVPLENNDFYRTFWNYHTTQNLSPQERRKQFDSIVRLSAVTMDPAWKSRSASSKRNALQNAATSDPSANERALRDLKWTLYVTAAGTLGVYFLTKNAVATSVILSGATVTIPSYLQNIDKLINAGTGAYTGYSILRDELSSYSADSARIINAAVPQDTHNSIDLNKQFPDLKIWVSKKFPTTLGHTMPASEDEYLTWVAASLNNVKNSPDLQKFLDEYLQKVEQVTSRAMSEIVAAENERLAGKHAEANRRQALERDRMAFYRSIQNAVGIVIGNIAAPHEAQILNTVIGSGFQVAMVGVAAMTPLGWAAIGISVATSVFSRNRSGGFEKAVMKALRNIQLQLNSIIDGINALQKGQSEILIQVAEVLNRIDRAETNLRDAIESIASRLTVVISMTRSSARDAFENSFATTNSFIEDNYRRKQWASFYNELLRLRVIAATSTNDDILTGRMSFPSPNAAHLRDSLFTSGVRPTAPINLYDHIGLLEALANFNATVNTTVTTERKPYHPAEFYVVASTIVDWLTLADLSKSDTRALLQPLLEIAQSQITEINNFASRDRVTALAEQYRLVSMDVLKVTRDALAASQGALAEKGEVAKLIEITSSRRPNVDKVRSRPIPSPLNAPDVFKENRNDHPLFAAALEAGIISAVRTDEYASPTFHRTVNGRWSNENPSPVQLDSHFPDFKIGTRLGRKANALVFNKVLVNAATGATLDFEIPYEIGLHVSGYADHLSDARCAGHECAYHVWTRGNRVVQKVELRTSFAPSIRQIVTAALLKAGLNPVVDFPALEKIGTIDDLLLELFGEWSANKKLRIVNRAKDEILHSRHQAFDGAGLALGIMSKLNSVVTSSEELVPFTLDYLNEAYVREDILTTLQAAALFDENRQRENWEKLRTDSSSATPPGYFFSTLANRQPGEKLNINSFVDFAAVITGMRLYDTVARANGSVRDIGANVSEPFFGMTVAKIKWLMASRGIA